MGGPLTNSLMPKSRWSMGGVSLFHLFFTCTLTHASTHVAPTLEAVAQLGF